MHLYSGTTLDFLDDSTHNRIAEKVSEGFERYFRYKPGQSEVQSWRNSLRAMADVVRIGDLTDNGITLSAASEYAETTNGLCSAVISHF